MTVPSASLPTAGAVVPAHPAVGDDAARMVAAQAEANAFAAFRPTRWQWAALGLALVAWLVMLAPSSLVSSDEGRYASLSLAMLQSGDWVTPRLNGLLYFEKPPLQYWMGALLMDLFGSTAFAARLWPGLCGLFTVAMLGVAASRLWGTRAGWHAVVIGLSTAWLVANSHFLTLDAGLTAWLGSALGALLIARREQAAGRSAAGRAWMLLAWASVGLAVLSKGVVGLLVPAAALLLQSAWGRDVSIWRRLEWQWGVPVLLVVTVPWFALVSRRNPDFAAFFFVHEHLQRYLTTVHHREGGWWYFVPVLAVGALPWTTALPAALHVDARDESLRILVSWAVFVFAFFSASSSKLPSYILPMFPALVLLLARVSVGPAARSLTQRDLWLPTAAWALLPVVLWAAPLTAHGSGQAHAMRVLAAGATAGAVLFLAGAWLARRLSGDRHDSAALTAVGVAHCLAVLVLMASHDAYGQFRSAEPIARALAGRVPKDAPVFAVRSYDHTLPFYLGRPVTLVDYRDEFAFGEQHEPGRVVATLDAFEQQWRGLAQAVAYVSPDTWAQLDHDGLPMSRIYDDGRRIVVIKP